jgi:hypothetical protein
MEAKPDMRIEIDADDGNCLPYRAILSGAHFCKRV